MRDKQKLEEKRQEIKQIIINRLKKGSTFRKDLHIECCRKLGKSEEPSLKPFRICKDMPDSWFDVPLKELLIAGIVRKKGKKKQFMFYELKKKRKESLNFSL